MKEELPDRMNGIEQRREIIGVFGEEGKNEDYRGDVDSIIFWDSIVAGVSYFEKFRLSRKLATKIVEFAEDKSAQSLDRMLEN